MQPLDFTRKMGATVVLPSSTKSPQLSISKGAQNNQDNPESSGKNCTATTQATEPQEPTALPKPGTPIKQLRTVPFPNVLRAVPIKYQQSLPEVTSDQPKQHNPSKEFPAKEFPSLDGDTIVASDTEALHAQDGTSKSPKEPICGAKLPDPMHVPFNNDTYASQLGGPKFAEKAPQQQSGIQAKSRPKVKETRRKPRPPVLNREAVSAVPSKSLTSSEEELLQDLFRKHQQNSQERAQLHQILKAKDTEYQDLFAASEDLYEQFQDLTKRYDRNEAQLLKLREVQPKWENRIKKLSEYVKGLSHDHNRLRDDARTIQQQQSTLVEDRKALSDMLRDIHGATEQGRTESKQQLERAHHDLEMLGITLKNQQIHQQQDEALLVVERDRNNILERQIFTFTASHSELLDVFTKHRGSISEEIHELLRNTRQVEATDVQASQNNLRPILEQCVSILQALPQTSCIQTEHLQSLGDSLHGFLDKLVAFCSELLPHANNNQDRTFDRYRWTKHHCNKCRPASAC